jgi:hypothetical protein
MVPIVVLDGFTRKLFPAGTSVEDVETARQRRTGANATGDIKRG